MQISEHFSNVSSSFFRWRGYLFLLLLPIILLSFVGFSNRMGSPTFEFLWEIGCFLISLLGLSVRVLTVGTAPRGTSGRTTKKPRADILNSTGMYSIVRHPLYWGNYLIALGISLFLRTWALPWKWRVASGKRRESLRQRSSLSPIKQRHCCFCGRPTWTLESMRWRSAPCKTSIRARAVSCGEDSCLAPGSDCGTDPRQ